MLVRNSKMCQIREMKNFIKQNIRNEVDAAQYNGMEYVLAMLEDREPEYIELKQEEPEEEKKVGRTVASGIRRRGNG